MVTTAEMFLVVQATFDEWIIMDVRLGQPHDSAFSDKHGRETLGPALSWSREPITTPAMLLTGVDMLSSLFATAPFVEAAECNASEQALSRLIAHSNTCC